MDIRQPSLFEDSQDDREVSTGLAIVARSDKELSKDQEKFNRLAKRIENLQQTIKSDTAKLERLLVVYGAELPQRSQTLAAMRLSLAKALGGTVNKIKYGKRQHEKLRMVILILCDEAFAHIHPDTETEEFYNQWSDRSYREELKCQTDAIKMEFAAQASQMFGIDIDLDEIDDTPEGYEQFSHKLHRHVEDLMKKEEERSSRRRKSKKRMALEEARKQEEEFVQRSIRSIYLSLAKALHPDTITDATEKTRNEELMKRVTAAYAAKDLAALLKLELEWVRAENNALETLPDEALKLYIAALKEQVDVLEQELHTLHMHPRYMDVATFAVYSESYAVRRIKDIARDCDDAVRDIDNSLKLISLPSPKKKIIELIDEYIAETSISNGPLDFLLDYDF